MGCGKKIKEIADTPNPPNHQNKKKTGGHVTHKAPRSINNEKIKEHFFKILLEGLILIYHTEKKWTILGILI